MTNILLQKYLTAAPAPNCYHTVKYHHSLCVSLSLCSDFTEQFIFTKLLNYIIVQFSPIKVYFTLTLGICIVHFTWHTLRLDKGQTRPGQIWNSYLYWNMIGLSMSFKLMIWQNPWKPRYKTLVFLCHIFLRMGGPTTSLLSLPHTRNNRKFYLFTK